MCLLSELKNKYFFIIDFAIILIIGIVHFVFFFYIKETDFDNIFDAFESSPLFDFSIGETCGSNSPLVFHTWAGREEKDYYYSNGRRRSRTKIVDVTDIKLINGHFFCYKHISYKDLLYNGQIIKKGETCPQEYQQNCGIIDTLKQELCIKNGDKCPLYDVGIGQNTDTINYVSKGATEGNIYYNNEDYNDPNKRIIGKLILNEGQPCYRLNEKKWRKFVSEEAGTENLKCELEVFGQFTDDRYDNKGDITYDKLYNDNLGSNYNLFNDKKEELRKTSVSLYKREFLGIDKTCDEENVINRDDYKKLRKNQIMEKICILVEAIIIFCFWIVLSIYICILYCKSKDTISEYSHDVTLVFLIICLVMNLICIICQGVFLGRIIKYDLSYDCSDEKTNEVLRLENLNTKKSILYTGVNLGLDIFYILFNVLAHLVILIKEQWEDCEFNLFNRNKDKETNNSNYNNNKNNFNVNDLYKEPIREVIVNNGIPNQFDKPVINNNYNNFNNLNNNINNNPDTPINDLGVPPVIAPGFSSDAKL